MKNLKLSLFLVALMLLATAGATSVQAADDTAVIVPPVVVAPVAVAENTPDRELKLEKRIEKIKARGASEIAKRVAALNKTKIKVDGAKLLTPTQKTDLGVMIDTNITGLSALGEQIKATTASTTARELVKKIYTDFRIYAVFLPKIHAYIALDQELGHVAKITERFTKVQARIDVVKAKGKDVTARQAALDSAKVKLAEATPKINELLAKAATLTPAGYPTSTKTVITEIRTGIKAVNDIFRLVNQSLKTAK